MRDHEEVFNRIYSTERWGKGAGSGTGSTPAYAAGWLNFIANAIPDGKHVLDIGCGDMQVYAEFDLTRWNYVGIDVSQLALDAAMTRYCDRNLIQMSALDTQLILRLIRERKIQYILMKDVMMHWTDEEIDYFLEKVCAKFNGAILIANNWHYVRKPSMNGHPRQLDRYSWAPLPQDHHVLMKYGFKVMGFYPAGKFKCVMLRS